MNCAQVRDLYTMREAVKIACKSTAQPPPAHTNRHQQQPNHPHNITCVDL
jgi:hypothetical protein